MFVGKYNNSIDSKSRVIVPAKFRDELEGRCIIAKSLDRCLTIYPLAQWEKFVEEKLEILPAGNPQARKLKRHFYSSAAECGQAGKAYYTAGAQGICRDRKRADNCRKRQDYRSVEQGALGR